ncbi:HAD-IIA family hydrolase [Nocardioides rotundus]|uniref:HAD-IIA family hydrolase n=1 Tax=Nocardioides rotundus TaxID=1774216 RepID=UPI001CC1B2E3|nr:HAD-IIA family hydrolase [Nocardioides rotundus]
MSDDASVLKPSDGPLTDTHDLLMFDLDGVVYIGHRAVPWAAESIDRARGGGAHIAFVTNNASRSAPDVAAQLTELGVGAEADDVVTSAQAAARLLAERYEPGAVIAVLGARGLTEAVRDAGLDPVPVGEDREDEAVALVTGYGPDVEWRSVMRAAARLRSGDLPWVASNTDLTLKTDVGIAPGHGVMVTMLSDFAGVRPDVAGKPAPPLLEETIRRVGGRRPLMVGDRLDTDMEGARAVDVPGLLVLTGVTGLPELVAARPQERPTYLAPDLRGLEEPHPAVVRTADGAECGGWRAAVVDGALTVTGAGEAADWWRAVAEAAWAHLDRTGDPAGLGDLTPPVPDETSVAG